MLVWSCAFVVIVVIAANMQSSGNSSALLYTSTGIVLWKAACCHVAAGSPLRSTLMKRQVLPHEALSEQRVGATSIDMACVHAHGPWPPLEDLYLMHDRKAAHLISSACTKSACMNRQLPCMHSNFVCDKH